MKLHHNPRRAGKTLKWLLSLKEFIKYAEEREAKSLGFTSYTLGLDGPGMSLQQIKDIYAREILKLRKHKP